MAYNHVQQSQSTSDVAPESARTFGPSLKQYQRTYQACLHCRQRKVKCIPENESGESKPTCVKCRRERRLCVFTRERRIVENPERGGEPHETGRTVRVIDERARQRTRRHISHHGRHRLTSSVPRSPIPPRELDPVDKDISIDSQSGVAWHECLIEGVIDSSITNQRDALNLLYKAVERRDDDSPTTGTGPDEDPSTNQPREVVNVQKSAPVSATTAMSSEEWCVTRFQLSKPQPYVLETWSACPLVVQKWMNALEAVTWVDLFFQNMAVLSPVLDDFYHSHEHHDVLVNEEPLLCATILMLSCRYHHLVGDGSLCRGILLHERLWKYCKSLLDQIRWGEERTGHRSRLRTIGAIQSLFLLAEWHPRLFHLNLDSDIWIMRPESANTGAQALSNWHDGVVEPVRKSNRMTWMLLGSALTLAHEFDLFNKKAAESTDGRPSSTESTERLKRLFFVFINNVTSRLGCQVVKTPFFHSSILAVLDDSSWTGRAEWSDWMAAWIDLTRIVRSSSEILFPDGMTTKQIVQDGRYSELLGHFGHVLDRWFRQYPRISGPDVRYDVLLIEYQYVRIYTNALAMQAIAARRKTRSKYDLFEEPHIHTQDHDFVSQVFDGCHSVLNMVLNHGDLGHLRYLPVRVHIQIASAAVYLIKALALGLQTRELVIPSLDLLENVAIRLRSNTVDDVYLTIRFASLIETHVKVLRRRCGQGAAEVTTRREPSSALDYASLLEDEFAFYDHFIFGDDWLAPQADASFFSLPDCMPGQSAFDAYGDGSHGIFC